MSGRSKSEYESKPLELSDQEREELYNEPMIKEAIAYCERMEGPPEGRWLDDCKVETLVKYMRFFIKREDYRERLIKYSRTRWLKSHIQCMRLKEQLQNIREKYGVVVRKRPDPIKRLSTYREDQLEKIAMRLESQEK